MLLLYATAIVLNAFLLFLIQPIFAKMALPLLGGSPAVWTTCVLFFQTLLLLGYLYSHFAVKLLGVRRHALLHGGLALLPIVLLPVGIPADSRPPADGAPIPWLLGVMSLSVGAPFLVLSTTAPLLQRWFSAARGRSGDDPYFLYAASNAGSLAALLSYPAVIEPLLSVRAQRVLWAIGYVIVGALLLACASTVHKSESAPERQEYPAGTRILWRRRLKWGALALVPSGLMLAVTTHISTDIAAVPLLWIVPLALYLATFIIAFSQAAVRAVRVANRILPFVLLPLVLVLVANMSALLWLAIPIHLLAFSIIALLCHGQLAFDRPPARHLTEFYVWIAAGGMAGGLFNTLAAPLLFDRVIEYPILIAAGCLLLAGVRAVGTAILEPRQLIRPAAAGLIAALTLSLGTKFGVDARVMLGLLGLSVVVLFSASRAPGPFAVGVVLLIAIGVVTSGRTFAQLLHSERTFFGLYRVATDAERRLMTLYHGSTLHGSQRAARTADLPEPLTYYHRASPIADVIRSLERRSLESIGVIGLGVGSLAAYARHGQQWVFYEIDPTVERLARDERYFTFLRSCGSACRVVLGDGRLSLAASSERHDLLVVDAFSSDAIPVHLLTREALQTYLGHLADTGILAFHISNRHFDLEPALSRLASELNLISLQRFDRTPYDATSGVTPSRWVVMARAVDVLSDLAHQSGWTQPTPDGNVVWTDDFSNIWSALRWGQTSNGS